MARSFLALLLAGVAVLSVPQRAAALDPVTIYVGKFFLEYLAGKGLDELYDNVSGAPDVRKIDERLKKLEENAALRSEMREEIRKVRDGLKDRPTKEELRKALGGLETQLTDVRKRIADLEERVELQEVKLDDLKDKTSKAENAFVFFLRGAQFAEKKDNYRAIANLSIAARMDPKASGSFLARAEVYLRMKAYDVAVIDYSEAVKRDAKEPAARLGRGTAYNALGQFPKAADDLTAALKEEPQQPDALLQRGIAYRALGRTKEAAADFRKCAATVPGATQAWVGLAFSEQANGDHAAAVAAFDKALALLPADTPCLVGRAHSQYKRGLHASAELDADLAVKAGATGPLAHEVRGLCRFNKGKKDDALADLAVASDRWSSNDRVYAVLGCLRLGTKEYAKSDAALTTAVALGATDWQTYENRAVARYNLAKHADAIADFAVVIKADPNKTTTGFAHWWTAQAHLVRGSRADFRAHTDKAIAADAAWQKKVTCGDAMFTNNSKTAVVVDIDYWIDEQGETQKFNFSNTGYKIGPGESFLLLYENKQVVGSKFQADVKTDKGTKRYYWNYKGGSTLEAAISDADLP